jgi:hypothetical protein
MLRTLAYGVALLGAALLAPSGATAQFTYPQRYCPPDRVPTKTDQGITFEGTSGRAYMEAFLSGDHYRDSRMDTGTTQLDASMLAILSDVVEADRSACSRLNSFMSNGETVHPSEPWVYFRAGSFYFVTKWTEPPVSGGRFTTGYGTILVFDSAFNLLGAWTG